MTDTTTAPARTPTPRKARKTPLQYLTGFGNEQATEAVPGTLPLGQNSPQRAAHGLYAEQLSGTSFTAPRVDNRRSWLYRIRPSVMHEAFSPLDKGLLRSAPITESGPTPNRFRWNPLPIPDAPTDFTQGITTMAATGDVEARDGAAYHVYRINKSMTRKVFANHDGDMIIMPQTGALTLTTEFGIIDIDCGEFAVIPRGIKFRVEVEGPSRGYICENYGVHFRLPELGPIGANGLANSRDFLTPVAAYEDDDSQHELVVKFGGEMWTTTLTHSPLDIVGWHGNYYPYKYDLMKFMSIGSISYDHVDPSIQTVLTSPSGIPGVANVELTVFPPRWLVADNTFRPPYFHRNVMCEFVCMVKGAHESHGAGFPSGACSMHNMLTAHGPDPAVFEGASSAPLQPQHTGDNMFVLLETRTPCRPTKFARETDVIKPNYDRTWDKLPKTFKK